MAREEVDQVRYKLEMKEQQSAAMLEELESEPAEGLAELEALMKGVQKSLDSAGQVQADLEQALEKRTADVEVARQQQRYVLRHTAL
eukprot:scaffold171811_cov32-Prasinocladus_malaysianus.AAC.1